MTLCSYSANGAGDTHEIADGQRRIDVTLAIDWGANDERNDHEKTIPFCSFDCLSKYAAGRAIAHDGRTVLKAESVNG